MIQEPRTNAASPFQTGDLSRCSPGARGYALDRPAEPPGSAPESVGVSWQRLQRIDEAIQRHIAEHHIAGAISLVARKGFVVHYEAHGVKDIESRKPMTRDAIFKMASSTKPVTAVAIMMGACPSIPCTS